MMRAGFAFALIASPAFAGDSVPMSALAPEVWQASVFEVTCRDLGDCCGLHRDCGDWYQRSSDPAPVPLPWAGLLLAAALGLLWRMRA